MDAEYVLPISVDIDQQEIFFSFLLIVVPRTSAVQLYSIVAFVGLNLVNAVLSVPTDVLIAHHLLLLDIVLFILARNF